MFNKTKFSKLLLLTLSLFIIISPVFVFAQTEVGETGSGNEVGETGSGKPIEYNIEIKNPFKSNTIKGLLEAIVNEILIPIGSVVAAIMVIYAGFLFVTARGNATQIEKAKMALLYAVIGAAILLGAWVITNAISATVNKLRA